MSLETDRYAAVTQIDQAATDQAQQAWAWLDPLALQSTFEALVLADLLFTLTVAQEAAVMVGADYVDQSLMKQGADAGPRIVPSAFSGISSSGQSLTGLLAQPLIRTMTGLALGVQPPVALRAGGTLLDSIVVTQVHDAARAAEFTAIAANAEAAGYIRVVEAGACSRCILLAGKFYKWNSGFRRHPRCRCSHHPVTTDSEPQDPKALFDALSRKEQDRVFTEAGASAIRDGADMSQIVNARLGMDTATVAGQKIQTTTQGATSRSYAGYIRREIGRQRGTPLPRKVVRLMPEEIIRQAAGNRAEARRLLISNGYIVGDIADLAAEAVRLAPQ